MDQEFSLYYISEKSWKKEVKTKNHLAYGQSSQQKFAEEAHD